MSTLIDCMVAVAVISIGAGLLATQHQHFEHANRRAIAVESVARALDLEMEQFRACADRACIEALAARANEERGAEVASWSRADIERKLEPGPNGTIKLTLTASAKELRADRKLVALLWVPK
jgi:type II secretory pathway pseudopilin PulG